MNIYIYILYYMHGVWSRWWRWCPPSTQRLTKGRSTDVYSGGELTPHVVTSLDLLHLVLCFRASELLQCIKIYVYICIYIYHIISYVSNINVYINIYYTDILIDDLYINNTEPQILSIYVWSHDPPGTHYTCCSPLFWVFCEDKTTQTDRQLWISKVNRTQIFYSWVYGLNIDPHLNTRLWRIWGKMTKFNMFLSSRMMLDNSITLPYSLVSVTPEIHGCHVFFRKRSIRRAFAMSLGTQILRSRNPLVPTCVGCWSSIYICVKILYIYIYTQYAYIYIVYI